MEDNGKVYAECGDGWKCLYQPLIDYIEKYNNEHKPDSYFEIHQIKEKFAGLRFYYDGVNIPLENIQELDDMIRKAEQESYHICEQCGAKENVGLAHGLNWYFTVCEDCLNKMAIENDRVTYTWKCNDHKYEINKNGKREINDIGGI